MFSLGILGTLAIGGLTLADASLIAAIISAFGSVLGGLLEMLSAGALASAIGSLGPWILAAVIVWQLGNIACAYINK